jgi:signal-transduction protein with cAMP-binding, CBS, and nucleotidyltransferase domain
MRNFILTISLALFSTVAFAQNNVSELIQKYKGNDDVNIVTISGSLLRMGSNFVEADDKESKAAKNIIDQVDELIILNTSSISSGREIRKFANKLVDRGVYEEMMMVDSQGEETTFYGKVRGNKIIELFIITGKNEDETVLISMSGKIDPDSVAVLLQKTGVN